MHLQMLLLLCPGPAATRWTGHGGYGGSAGQHTQKQSSYRNRLLTGRAFALSFILPYFIVFHQNSVWQKSEAAIKGKGRCMRDPHRAAEPAAWGNRRDLGYHQGGGVGRERVSCPGKGVQAHDLSLKRGFSCILALICSLADWWRRVLEQDVHVDNQGSLCLASESFMVPCPLQRCSVLQTHPLDLYCY